MKVLFLTEAHFIKTGYAIYSSNILSRLKRDGFEVAELGVYSADSENRIKDSQWTFYSNLPSEDELKDFHSDPSNHYGKFRFESVVCDFKPDVVCTIRDLFMDDFVYYSPLRNKFHWIAMSPVDGLPQQPEWLNIANQADTLLTYTDWGRDHLKEYGINATTASPAASSSYFPYPESDKIKKAVGLEGKKIIGTVMRNQPRKLFENLIEGFSIYSKKNKDAVLYLHTSVPDVGFNLVKLLFEHQIMSKTLFTYSCSNCKSSFPMYFSDYITWCPKCKTKTVRTSDIYSALSEEDMNKIFNLFDVYIQPACREGFGMPQAEAAACGIPIITTPYAGMNDIKNYIYECDVMKIGGFKLQNQMHMHEAVIDVQSISDAIERNIDKKKDNQRKIRESFENRYNSWENVYQIWKDKISNVDIKKISTEKNIRYKVNKDLSIDTKANYLEFSKNLIKEFIGERYLNTHLHYRIIRDLNQGYTMNDINNYFVQHFDSNGYFNFNKKDAIDVMSKLAKRRLYWEQKWNESINNGS